MVLRTHRIIMEATGEDIERTGTPPCVSHVDALPEMEGPGSLVRVETALPAPSKSPRRPKARLPSKMTSSFTSGLKVGGLVASLTKSLNAGKAAVSGSARRHLNRSDSSLAGSKAAEVVANEFFAQGEQGEVGELSQQTEVAGEASCQEDSTAAVTPGSGSRQCSNPQVGVVGDAVASATEAAVAGMTMPRLIRSDSGGVGSSMAVEAGIVASEYFAQAGGQQGGGQTLAVDDASNREESTAGVTPVSSSHHSRTPEEDALALEVGHNAHAYLEECFYTEVNVLDRERFDAVPEIEKSDLAILGHLGKGNFSDVFEVVSKTGQLIDTNACVDGSQRRRGSARRRSRLSSSVNRVTTRPPQGSRPRLVFALKCLRPQIRSDVDQFTIGAEDLVHETAILANLNHRHIIKLHGRASGQLRDAFVLNDGYFILLDKLAGTLPDRIDAWSKDKNILLKGPTAEQLDMAHSIADAMSYLHSKRIIFRDLKPANVGFDTAGVPKLFDFGFAVGLPDQDEANPSGLLFDRCGTPRYMAPEVGLSLGYALPSDVYSFGILLWEICSLSKPFAEINSSAEFDRRVFIEGLRPQMQARWPGAVRELMRMCWQPRPLRRPTMEVVKTKLSLAMTGGNAPARDLLRSKLARRSSDDV